TIRGPTASETVGPYEGTMDSPIALALMAKAQLVFGSNDTFLSFPLFPLAYKKEQLDFKFENLTVERSLYLTEFSQRVDRVPHGVIWSDTEEQCLSDIYWEILRTAKVATAKRTPEEEADYQKAFRFLHDIKPDGTISDSAAVIAYKQWEQAHFNAIQHYNGRRIAALSYTKPEEKQQWEQMELPQLEQGVRNLEQEWAAKGFRSQVDEARHIVEALESKAPSIWQEWKTQLIPDIDNLTDVSSLQEYTPSWFSPSNILETSGWGSFGLSASEVQSLVQQAPPDLKNRLAPNPIDLDIESLSFEASSVAVTRAWFEPAVFKARFWKFYDGAKLISDGQSGICPAYVAALVLARNPVLKLKPNSSKNTNAITRLKASPAFSLGVFNVAAPTAATAAQPATVLYSARTIPIAATAKLTTTVAPPAPAATAMRSAHIAMAAPAPMRMTVPNSGRGVVRPAPRVTVAPNKLALIRMQERTFPKLPTPPPPRPVPVPPAPPPVTAPPPNDEIYILAFICKRLPPCPNPDPALQW
ncbi:MAG: hypothetical protein ACREJU_11415, partial [Nitrospiraceae bacterium]